MTCYEYRVFVQRYAHTGWAKTLEKQMSEAGAEGFRFLSLSEAGGGATVIMVREVPPSTGPYR